MDKISKTHQAIIILGLIILLPLTLAGLLDFSPSADARQQVPVEVQQWQKGWNASLEALKEDNAALQAQMTANYRMRVSHCEMTKLGAQMKITYGMADVNSKEYAGWKNKTLWDCPLKSQQNISDLSRSFPLSQ